MSILRAVNIGAFGLPVTSYGQSFSPPFSLPFAKHSSVVGFVAFVNDFFLYKMPVVFLNVRRL